MRIFYLVLQITFLSSYPLFTYAQETQARQTVRLYLSSSQQFEYAGYYAAQMQGYYNKAGLELKFVAHQSGRQAADVLLDGDADFAVADSAILLQQSRGKAVKIIAAIFQHSPQIFLAMESSGIRNVHDLIGKRLMFSRQQDSLLYAMLKQAGISDKQYTHIENTQELQALLDGKVDAIAANLTDQPDLLDRMGYQHYIIDPASYGLDFYGDMLITSSNKLASDEKQVKAFRDASLLGWKYALEHPSEVINYILAQAGNNNTRRHLLYEARTTRLAIAPSLVKIGNIDPQRMEAIASNYIRLGILPEDFKVSSAYILFDKESMWLETLSFIAITFLIAVVLSQGLLRYRETQKRLKFEKTIAEANNLFTTTFDKSPLMMAIKLVPESNITLVNDAMLHTLGYTREEIIGQTLVDIGMLDEEADAESLNQLQSSGQSSFDINFNTRSGEQRSGRLSSNLIRYHDYNAALIIIEDTTKYKRAEDALRSSELRFRTIFDYSFSGITLADSMGKIITANHAFANIIGYDSDELIGTSVRELSYPDDMQEEDKRLQAIRNGEIDHFQFTKRLVRKDGTLAWIETAVRVIRDDQGQPYRYVSVVNDISEKLKTEKETQKLQRQLQQTQKMEAIGQLTGGIAHDFNNILASILGFAELSRTVYSDSIPEKLDNYLKEIINVGQRARNIVDQLLIFSRGNARDTELLDPATAIKESVTFLRSTLPSTVELVAKLDEEARQIYTSPLQLNQVLLNLVLNARRAIKDSGKIQITTKQLSIVHSSCASCHQDIDGDYLSIEVCDDGPGIEPVMVPRIFEPFFTTTELGEGSGMGLAMVHGIVHSSKGHIRIYPSESGGACIQLLFPILGESKKQKEIATEENAAATQSVRGKHILVVDDETPITELMQEVLSMKDFRVSVFNNPQQALQAFRSNPQDYDLLLTDQTMPVINGTELAAKMHELRPELPVILCTGYSNLVHPDNMSEFEIDRLLYKPVNNKQLLNTVTELLATPSA